MSDVEQGMGWSSMDTERPITPEDIAWGEAHPVGEEIPFPPWGWDKAKERYWVYTRMLEGRLKSQGLHHTVAPTIASRNIGDLKQLDGWDAKALLKWRKLGPKRIGRLAEAMKAQGFALSNYPIERHSRRNEREQDGRVAARDSIAEADAVQPRPYGRAWPCPRLRRRRDRARGALGRVSKKPTTYGDISDRVAAYAANEMLRHATHPEILRLFGEPPRWWQFWRRGWLRARFKR